LGIPITTIGFTHEECSSVAIDDLSGGRIATKHLTDLGHREIAILSGQRETAYNFTVSEHRTIGYVEMLNTVGVEWNPDLEIRGDFNIYTSEIAMDSFLGRKKLPSAIFCHSDEMAFGALKALQKKGMSVPGDMSVIGFDDHEIAQYIGLTTVAQPPQFEGQMAAAAVIAEITNPAHERKNIIVPTEQVSYSIWVKPNRCISGSTIFEIGTSDYMNLHTLVIDYNKLKLIIYNNRIEYTEIINSNVNTNTWSHIVWALDSKTGATDLYVNNILVYTGYEPYYFSDNNI
jgi:hypothetical protein